eukprot:UN16109
MSDILVRSHRVTLAAPPIFNKVKVPTYLTLRSPIYEHEHRYRRMIFNNSPFIKICRVSVILFSTLDCIQLPSSFWTSHVV